MSELREECYKCLNNQSCIPGADYGSIYCSLHRKYKMPGNDKDSIYAHKFAIMKKQIDEKEKEIQDLKQALAINIAKNFTSSMKESAKSKDDLEMLNKGWQIELEKKDKIIYEMIGSFIDMGFGFEYCNNDNRCINNCEKCIKQYFEKLAERKSEE